MTPAPTEPPGIGAYLASQRKLRGLSIEDLESLTHIPRRSLERLEAGVYDAQPDGFVRGFVRTVSLAIGLDPEDTVARMLDEPELGAAHARLSGRRVLAAVGGLLLLALGLILIPGLLREHQPPLPVLEIPEPAPVRRDHVRALAEATRALQPPRPAEAPPASAALAQPGVPPHAAAP